MPQRLCSLSTLIALLLLFCCMLPLLSLPQCEAKIASGDKFSNSCFTYLDKFCFATSGGLIRVQVEESPTVALTSQQRAAGLKGQQIGFYADSFDAWPAIYKIRDISCAQQLAKATLVLSVHDLQNSAATNRAPAGVTLLDVESSRPRWFYVALINPDGHTPFASNSTTQLSTTTAGGQIGLQQFELQFTNAGGLMLHQFSFDEASVLQQSIVYMCVFILLLPLLQWMRRHAKSKQMQYLVLKQLMLCTALAFLSSMFDVIHYGRFASDGRGASNALALSYVTEFMSVLVLLHIFLNLSKGWTISTNFVIHARRQFAFLALYWIAYLIFFAWQQLLQDPATTLFVYSSVPGLALVLLRLVSLALFLYNLQQTFRAEHDAPRRRFYVVLLCSGTWWICMLPLIVLIAAQIDSWQRAKVVYAMTHIVHIGALLLLMWLFRPFRRNRFFVVMRPDECRAFGDRSQQMQTFPMPQPSSSDGEAAAAQSPQSNASASPQSTVGVRINKPVPLMHNQSKPTFKSEDDDEFDAI